MYEEMQDLITFMKALHVSRSDALGIALLLKGRKEETDDMNEFLVECIETNKKPTSGYILMRAMALVKNENRIEYETRRNETYRI